MLVDEFENRRRNKHYAQKVGYPPNFGNQKLGTLPILGQSRSQVLEAELRTGFDRTQFLLFISQQTVPQ